MRFRAFLFILILTALFAQGCRLLYPSRMLRLPKDFHYTDFDSIPTGEYRIRPGDRMTLQVFSNDNYNNVITIVPTFDAGFGANNNIRNQQSYEVRFDSLVRLPVIGEVNLCGMSIPEAEYFLGDAYGKYYESPFVRIRIVNRRVIVFPSGSASARIVTLNNENMSLLEVLAQVGGIPGNAKAYDIRVIRGDLKDPQISRIDLSTLEGMRQANLRVEPNDIIYIEPRYRVSTGILREISPILGLVSSVTTLYLLYLNLKSNP